MVASFCKCKKPVPSILDQLYPIDIIHVNSRIKRVAIISS